MKMEDLESAMLKYNYLVEKDKEKMNKLIGDLWKAMSTNFASACNKDEEYMEVYSKVVDINSVLNFDVGDEYYYPTGMIYGTDEEIDEEEWAFSEEKYKEHKYIAENLEDLNAKLQNEIEKLKKNRFVINREEKIRNLEDELLYNEESAKKYNRCVEKEALKKQYLSNPKTYIEPAKERYKEILLRHAKSVVKDMVEQYPEILCQSHTGRYAVLTETQGNILNEVFNEFRTKVLEDINKKKTTIKR